MRRMVFWRSHAELSEPRKSPCSPMKGPGAGRRSGFTLLILQFGVSSGKADEGSDHAEHSEKCEKADYFYCVFHVGSNKKPLMTFRVRPAACVGLWCWKVMR